VPRWLMVLAAVCLLAGTPRVLAQPAQQYAVDGLAVGARIPFDRPAYREYKCGPSDQFDGFMWCQKTRQEKERRGKFSSTYSILHSGGVAVYIDRYLEPAFFGAREAEDDIQRYSRKLGEIARIARMPHRADFPNGILASWGKVELEPLDNDTITALAEGRDPTTKGYLVDFIGDFARSAKERLPIYRISGGAGFVWVASFDQRGLGTLRLTAVDASVLALTTTPSAPIDTAESAKEKDAIANSTNQLSEAYQRSAGQAKIDPEPARDDAEAREEALRARADIDKAAATQRAKVWPLAATAQLTMPPTQATTVNPPQIQVVRVKRIDPAVPQVRFQLSDGSVDLTRAFSLGGFEGVGGTWKMPPTDETFAARFGRW